MLIAALDNVLLWIITLITTLDKREGELIFRYGSTSIFINTCAKWFGLKPRRAAAFRFFSSL